MIPITRHSGKDKILRTEQIDQWLPKGCREEELIAWGREGVYGVLEFFRILIVVEVAQQYVGNTPPQILILSTAAKYSL